MRPTGRPATNPVDQLSPRAARGLSYVGGGRRAGAGACQCDERRDEITAMVTPGDRQFLIDVLAPLGEPLHHVLPRAVDFADGHFTEHDMTSREFRAGRAHLARCHARRLLAALDPTSLGGWRVVTKAGTNTRLWLEHGTLSMRLLRPLPGGNVPHPGYNPSRIAYYGNDRTNLFGVAGSDLIAIWDVIYNTHEALIRIIRPTGAWKYGQKARVDLDTMLPVPPTSLTELEFRPSDDLGLKLPMDEEGENGEGEIDKQ